MRYGTFGIDTRFRLSFWGLIAVIAFGSPFVARPLAQKPTVRLNRTIEMLHRGEPVIGTINRDFSIYRAREVATAPIDFVIIDMEHQPMDFETLRTFLLGMINKEEIMRKGNLQPDVTPLIRIAQYGRENLQYMVKQALDEGVLGVMFPAISTKEEAISAVRAARFPSNNKSGGLRGCCPDDATWYWGFSNSAEFARRTDTWPVDPQGEVLLLLQIETAEGVRNIDDIISVPGVGVIFVGPNDLSHSMDVKQGSPEHEAAIQTVLKACLAKNVPCAITTGAKDIAQRIKQGFRMVTIGGAGLTVAGDAALKAGRAASKP
jgi:4-hydroxy-2-oxoheptanedioate aldolase